MPVDGKEITIATELHGVKISVVFSKSHLCETTKELAYLGWNVIIALRINFVKLFLFLHYADNGQGNGRDGAFGCIVTLQEKRKPKLIILSSSSYSCFLHFETSNGHCHEV
jgi:hypothetical protein